MHLSRQSTFIEGEFVVLVLVSALIAALIYRALWSRRPLSRTRALIFGLTLIVLAGVDVFLLRMLASLSRVSGSIFDRFVFDSELTVALYILPTLFAGTGINVVSHLVIHPLALDRNTRRAYGPDPVGATQQPDQSP
ncbi:MAG: hypothetical protein ABSC32_16105 [Steroidobacteraceae bacterium]|jgi:hypothetical protein